MKELKVILETLKEPQQLLHMWNPVKELKEKIDQETQNREQRLVESGEGIESSHTSDLEVLQSGLWNPVKELKVTRLFGLPVTLTASGIR